MENLSAQRDQGEIKCGDTGRCRGIRQAALKNNVHIHQSITNHGVAEAQGDQHQAQYGELHPRVQRHAEHQR